jgi:hypothetical protein
MTAFVNGTFAFLFFSSDSPLPRQALTVHILFLTLSVQYSLVTHCPHLFLFNCTICTINDKSVKNTSLYSRPDCRKDALLLVISIHVVLSWSVVV